IFHIMRGEFSFFVPMNLVLAAVAAFIAYGRLLVRPIVPSSVSTFRMLAGLAVLGALILLGYAPISYQLKHSHSKNRIEGHTMPKASKNNKKELLPKQHEELLKTFKVRFEKNMNRHEGLAWPDVQAKLGANAEKLWSLSEMERTGGEPDVVGHDKK